MINVAVTGAGGRMGSMIINTILQQDDMQVVAAIEAPNTPLEGRDVGEVMGIGPINVPIVGAEKLNETLKDKKPEVLVDFTIAAAAVGTIKTTAECGVNLVVGTTGFTEEQMVAMLREADRTSVAEVARKHKVSEQTIYTWRQKFGSMDPADVKRLRALEAENTKLKRMLADSMLDNVALKDLLGKKW